MKLLILSAVLALPLALVAQDKKPEARGGGGDKAPQDPNAAAMMFQKACYPLKTCAVCGHELDKKTVDSMVDKHLVAVCSDGCKAGIEAKKAEIIKKIDDGVIAAQKAAYPLEKCPISGEKLGGMGDPVDHVVGMRLVRLCCNKCVAAVDANPDETFAKLERAYIASQKGAYKVAVCPVDGTKLEEGKAMDALYGTQLVRLCSEDCKKTLNRSPHRVLNQLENLKAGKPYEPGEKGGEKGGEKRDGGGKEGRGKEGGEKKGGGGGGEKKNG
jgi:hypothetical protein